MESSSFKVKAKALAIKSVNTLGVSSKYIGGPKAIYTTGKWIENFGSRYGARFIPLLPPDSIHETPPVTLDKEVHEIFRNEYKHETPDAFVAIIPNARVWGRNGTVITPNDYLLSDVSREFGAYGGVMGKAHSVNKQIYLHKCQRLKGKVAVIGTAGTYNYHHWLYDTFSRIHLLQLAGVFEQIDYFIIDYNGLPFQKESLQKAGIPLEKIICATDTWRFHVEAETLVVPSLPSKLGRVGAWPVDYLRKTFLQKKSNKCQRLYISRRKATSRKLINEEDLYCFLQTEGFTEFFPEDHSIEETASRFANADYIVGVHGSGFANLAFISPQTKVIDIVAPRHLDPYYWMLTNRNSGKYAYIFGEGERPDEKKDLNVQKVDNDIFLDIPKFKEIFKKL